MTTADSLQEEETKDVEEVMVRWERHKRGYRSARRVRQTSRESEGKQVRSVMFLQGFVLTHL